MHNEINYSKHISPLNSYHHIDNNIYNKVSNCDFDNNININESVKSAYNMPLTKTKSQNIFNYDNNNYKYNNILYKEYKEQSSYNNSLNF